MRSLRVVGQGLDFGRKGFTALLCLLKCRRDFCLLCCFAGGPSLINGWGSKTRISHSWSRLKVSSCRFNLAFFLNSSVGVTYPVNKAVMDNLFFRNSDLMPAAVGLVSFLTFTWEVTFGCESTSTGKNKTRTPEPKVRNDTNPSDWVSWLNVSTPVHMIHS